MSPTGQAGRGAYSGAEGLRIWKVRDGRWYNEFGPYTLISDWNRAVMAKAIPDLDTLESGLAE